MKQLTQISFFLLAFLTLTLHSTTLKAQEVLTEGSLTFELTTIESDNQKLKQSMQGTTNEIHFKGAWVKADLKTMGGSLHLERVKNEQTRESNVYLDLMGKQMKVSVPDSIQKIKQKAMEDDSKIMYDSANIKFIKGYKCYKATVETLKEDGSIKQFQLYITEAIQISASIIIGLPQKLKGFPLEYTVITGETELGYTLKAFQKTLKTDGLKAPDTYPDMAYKEFEAMVGKKLGL